MRLMKAELLWWWWDPAPIWMPPNSPRGAPRRTMGLSRTQGGDCQRGALMLGNCHFSGPSYPQMEKEADNFAMKRTRDPVRLAARTAVSGSWKPSIHSCPHSPCLPVSILWHHHLSLSTTSSPDSRGLTSPSLMYLCRGQAGRCWGSFLKRQMRSSPPLLKNFWFVLKSMAFQVLQDAAPAAAPASSQCYVYSRTHLAILQGSCSP